MKKFVSRFLTPALSTFVLTTSIHSLDAAFIEATPTTELTVTGRCTDVYLHGTASIRVGEGLFPLNIHVIVDPSDGAKTKITVRCGDAETRYISGTPGIDLPKSFPAFLESGPNNQLQLEDPTLPVDKKLAFCIVSAYQGMPVMLTLTLSNLAKLAGGAPSLTVTGNGHERFAISSIVPKGGVLVAKSLTGQESALPPLDFSSATKADIVEFLRKLALQMPANLATFSIESKTTTAGTETTFSANVHNQ